TVGGRRWPRNRGRRSHERGLGHAGICGTGWISGKDTAAGSDRSGDFAAGSRSGDAGACHVNAADILIEKKKGEDCSSPKSKTWSIALFHSHRENDVRGAVRQVDPELVRLS